MIHKQGNSLINRLLDNKKYASRSDLEGIDSSGLSIN